MSSPFSLEIFMILIKKIIDNERYKKLRIIIFLINHNLQFH